MRYASRLIAVALLTAGAAAAQAADEAPGFWVTPAIPGYGRMHPLPHAAYKPAAAQTYRIVFALTTITSLEQRGYHLMPM